ncbi:chemotaxis protein CheX [Gammaproteobacteria bacterium]
MTTKAPARVVAHRPKVQATNDILLILCRAVQNTLATAINSPIQFSPMVQRIQQTCLRPDIGCFVTVSGGFSGLVVMNFTAGAAMEIYSRYMKQMGMHENELATLYTSDEVSNTLGELMNQCVGKFHQDVETQMHVSLNQSQPKMLVINQELLLAVNAKLEQPQFRKVSFKTYSHKPFYIELAIERTEFFELYPVGAELPETQRTSSVDDILDQHREPPPPATPSNSQPDDDFMSQLGL